MLLAAGPPGPIYAPGRDPGAGVLVNRTIGQPPWAAPDASKPTVVFIHGANPFDPLLHFTMDARLGEALHRAYGPRFNALGWDWNADTIHSISPRRNWDHAVVHGQRLGQNLLRAGLHPSRIHLIGQSSGAIVAAAAARSITDQSGIPVAQLTLLDPASFTHPLIFGQLGASTSATLAENYFVESPSGLGKPAPGVWNYRVPLGQPSRWVGLVRPLRSDHLNTVRWYLATIEHPGSPGGFSSCRFLARAPEPAPAPGRPVIRNAPRDRVHGPIHHPDDRRPD
jgi:hypothetical protein